MTTDEVKPWDQREGEPEAAYVRFLIYRNLGPARSLDLAYRTFQEGQEGAPESVERRAPGQWYGDSRTFAWVERARAWDIAMLAEHGQDAVMVFVGCLKQAAVKVLRSLDRLDGPADWKSAMESLNVLSSLIPAETIKAMQPHAGDGTPPGYGQGSGAGAPAAGGGLPH
jgi:hypothetical protein